MKKRISNSMSKIKLWQEEVKLVVMLFGAVASVGTFFYKMFHGGLFSETAQPVLKEVASGGGRSHAISHHFYPRLSETVAVANNNSLDLLVIAAGVLSIIFLVLCIYFLIKVMKKRMGKV